MRFAPSGIGSAMADDLGGLCGAGHPGMGRVQVATRVGSHPSRFTLPMPMTCGHVRYCQ